MSNCPVFSFVVPVYNISKYLKECVSSIISQNYSDYEIILVDDGSTDGSEKICDQLAESDLRIKVIHQKNGGLSDARNSGIKKAVGDYILFVDGDDFIGKNSLIRIKEVLEKYPDIDVMFLEATKVFPDGKKVPMNDGYNAECINGKPKECVMNHLSTLPKYPGSACTKLIKRKIIVEKELFFEKGALSEDIEWTIKLLLLAEKFAYCKEDYYFYRQNREGSITNTSGLKSINCLLKTIEKCGRDSVVEKYQKEVNSFLAYEYMIVLLNYACLSENKENIRKKIKEYSWILKYSNSTKTKVILILYRLLGLDLLSNILKLYYQIRER